MKLPKKKKTLIWLLVGAGLLVVGTVAYYLIVQNPSTLEPAEETEQATVSQEEGPSMSLRFAAMGDMLAHDSVVQQAKTADGYDFSPYFANIKGLYENSDVVFCNPETPAAGTEFGISGYPTFNAPLEFSRDLSGAGCNLINFANNHIADKGAGALAATLDAWEKLEPLAVAGAHRSQEEQQTVRYFEKNGLKVAFLAFADFSNAQVPRPYSVNFYHDQQLVRQQMQEARENADVVVVSAHWGTEDSHVVNQDQRQTAALFSGLGADVIIGTGPHVLQEVDMISRTDGQSTLVWYSIGNMLSSQLHTAQLTGGVALFTVSVVDGTVQISDVAFEPTFMSYEWSAADRTAGRLDTRRNLKLQPLATAVEETKHFGVTVEGQKTKVRQWLGDSTEVKLP